jgi:hypothetical protein
VRRVYEEVGEEKYYLFQDYRHGKAEELYQP